MTNKNDWRTLVLGGSESVAAIRKGLTMKLG